MSYAKKFENTLDKLFKRRTEWLRREITDFKPGPPNKWTKKIRDSGIKKLMVIAEDILATDFAKEEIKKHPPKYKRKIKGRGSEKKIIDFKTWYDREISKENCVYVFVGKKSSACGWAERKKAKIDQPPISEKTGQKTQHG